MSFSRTVFLGACGWAALITLLHAGLNWGLFDPRPAGTEARAKFKVGFLPVT